jgi:hypothetical protein
MASSGGLCFLLQARMKMNCLTFSSAKASQLSSRVTTATVSHLYRSKWEVMSGISGSNVMIRRFEQLCHHNSRGDETPDCCCAAIISPSSRRSSRGKTLMRVTAADRGTTTTTTDEETVLIEEDVAAETNEKVDYNWTEEWYPVYLTDEMPSNAPLGLTVFDKSLVLLLRWRGQAQLLERSMSAQVQVCFVLHFQFKSSISSSVISSLRTQIVRVGFSLFLTLSLPREDINLHIRYPISHQ